MGATNNKRSQSHLRSKQQLLAAADQGTKSQTFIEYENMRTMPKQTQ